MSTLEAICWSAVSATPKLSNNVRFDAIGVSCLTDSQLQATCMRVWFAVKHCRDNHCYADSYAITKCSSIWLKTNGFHEIGLAYLDRVMLVFNVNYDVYHLLHLNCEFRWDSIEYNSRDRRFDLTYPLAVDEFQQHISKLYDVWVDSPRRCK